MNSRLNRASRMMVEIYKDKYRLLPAFFLIFVFVVLVYRIINLSLVHDEGATLFNHALKPLGDILYYDYAKSGDILPNNHILNTLLMGLGVKLFGIGEWSLRLGAWIASAVFLLSVYFFASKAKGFFIFTIAGLSVLSPFVLDFMSLARGYGLALALMFLALAMDVADFSKRSAFSLARSMSIYSLLFLTVLSNFSFLYPAMAVASVSLVWRLKQRQDWKSLLLAISPALLSGLFIVLPSLKVFRAHQNSLLQFGGQRDFWSDTFISVIETALYGKLQGAGLRAAGITVGIVSGVFIVYLIRKFLIGKCTKQERIALYLWTVFVIICLMTVFAFKFLGVSYPMERSSIYFGPLLLLAFGFSLSGALEHAGRLSIVIGLSVAVLLVWNYSNFDPLATYTWPADKEVDRAVAGLAKNHDKISVGESWKAKWFVNYYLIRNFEEPIDSVSIYQNDVPGKDYYFLYEEDYGLADKYGLVLDHDVNAHVKLFKAIN